MYITEVVTKTKKGKISHRCILLRESYREKGKTKNRTLANLTHCKPDEIAALRLALKHKGNLPALQSVKDFVELRQGKSAGAVLALYEIARRLGIEKALGTERAGKLALWQVLSRVIGQGSRLSAIRLAQRHAACDVLGLREGFNEEHLYTNLGWLSDNQGKIEEKLLKARLKEKRPELFLYDVISSYLEGECNELGDWGYNRDKKSGKKQVVIGLLCDEGGDPVSGEVFRGNTGDSKTFGNQVKKAAERFRCRRVTFVGDRGMIKSGQIPELETMGFHYITAITKPQIEKLVKIGVIQRGLFDKDVCEIGHDGIRYILRRNPIRAEEMADTRKQKKEAILQFVHKRNDYLSKHLRAQVITAIEAIMSKMKRLKVEKWLQVEVEGRTIQAQEDEAALAQEAELDCCYVIKTDLPQDIDKQTIHDRYKDLADVEKAFRTCKTGMLEMRPWYVQTERSTRGHALVVMLAYLITRYLQKAWMGFDVTVQEGLEELETLCSTEVIMSGSGSCQQIPTPNETSAQLLNAIHVKLPKVLPSLGAIVVTRKKLQERRSSR